MKEMEEILTNQGKTIVGQIMFDMVCDEPSIKVKTNYVADKKEGIKICVDTINQVREIEGIAGVHIMAIEWE